MKILVATGIYPPDIGGPATYSKLLCDELPKRGIAVTVLSFGEVRHLPKIVRHAMYLLKLLTRARGADAIFAQDTVSVGFPALVGARLMGKKFYIRVPGDYAWEQSTQLFGVRDTIDEFQHKKYAWRVELLRGVQKFVVSHANLVVTPSVYFKNLVSAWCKDPSRVHHVYNGISLAVSSLSKDEARVRHGIPDNVKIVISAGRLVPWKGFARLIDAFGILKKNESLYRLYIFGDGPDRQMLEQHIKEQKLEEAIFLPGSVSREELFEYLAAADVFVLNTSFESFSFQLVEAMFLGIPVVSTSIGNIPEIIENNSEGILVQPDDSDAICAAIRKFEDDPEFRNQTIDRARTKSMQFSIQNTLDRLVSILTSTQR